MRVARDSMETEREHAKGTSHSSHAGIMSREGWASRPPVWASCPNPLSTPFLKNLGRASPLMERLPVSGSSRWGLHERVQQPGIDVENRRCHD